MKRLLIVAATLSMPTFANAQCEALLRDGVFDFHANSSEEDRIQSYLNWERDRRSNSSASGTTAEAGYGSFSAIYGQQNSQQVAQDIEKYNKADLQLRTRVMSYAKTANQYVINGFNECMQSSGLHVWLEKTDNPRIFRLAARYNNPGSNPRPALRHIIASPAAAVSREGHRLPYAVGGEDPRWVFTRKGCDAVALTVNSSERALGGGKLSLPALQTADCMPIAKCDLKNARIMVHYSEVHAGAYLGKANPILEEAGASPIDTYMKPKSETGMQNWFRIYHWPGRPDALAQEAKKCLDTTGLAPNGFVVSEANPQFMTPHWKDYSAIIYLVNQ